MKVQNKKRQRRSGSSEFINGNSREILRESIKRGDASNVIEFYTYRNIRMLEFWVDYHLCFFIYPKEWNKFTIQISLQVEQLVAFEWIVGEIESRFLQSLVAPGERIAYVAA